MKGLALALVVLALAVVAYFVYGFFAGSPAAAQPASPASPASPKTLVLFNSIANSYMQVGKNSAVSVASAANATPVKLVPVTVDTAGVKPPVSGQVFKVMGPSGTALRLDPSPKAAVTWDEPSNPMVYLEKVSTGYRFFSILHKGSGLAPGEKGTGGAMFWYPAIKSSTKLPYPDQQAWQLKAL